MTSDPTMDYFEEYRQKIREIKVLQKEMHELQELVSCKRSMIESLGREVDGMRRIITVMIDRGMDPVEAKLKTDTEDRREDIWKDWIYDHSTITASIGGGLGQGTAAVYTTPPNNWSHPTTVITNTGAITTIGSISATGSTRVTGAQGAVGSRAGLHLPTMHSTGGSKGSNGY